MKEQYQVGDFIYEPHIYDGMNTFLSDLDFYRKWLPTHQDAEILELCCGTGRLTIPIAQEGYQISGVDLTPSMLEEAKRKALEKKLEIDFIQGDIRTLDLSQQFDFIFVPFNSIHHLYRNSDISNALRCIKNHLKDEGYFLLDCFNPDLQLIVESSGEPKIISNYATTDGRKVVIKETMHYEKASQINRIKWHYFVDNEFHSIQNLDMRIFFPQELDSYLEWNGFHIVHKFGSFAEEPFTDGSQKQIYVLKHQE